MATGKAPELGAGPDIVAIGVTNRVPASEVFPAIGPRKLASGNQAEARDALSALMHGAGLAGQLDLRKAADLINQLDVAGVKASVKQLGRFGPKQGHALMQLLAARWVEIDSMEAFESARRDSSRDWKEALGSAAAERIAETNPRMIVELIGRRVKGSRDEKPGEWLLMALAKRDPAQAALLITSPENRDLRDVLGVVAHAYGKTSPEEAFAWAASLPDRDSREPALKLAWSGYAQNRPEEVAGLIARGEAVGLDEDVYQVVAEGLSTSNPTEALKWIESLPEGRGKQHAYRALKFDLEKWGTGEAKQFLDGISSEDVKANLAGQFAGELSRQGVAQGLEWAESLDHPQTRAHALSALVNEWTQEDPAAAAKFAAARPELNGGGRAFEAAFGQWAQNDPDEAFAFSQTLEGNQRELSVAHAVRAVAKEDPEKALKWFNAIGDDQLAATAAQELLPPLVRQNPSAAIEIIQRLPADAQSSAYENMIRGWGFSDPAKAGEWVKTLPNGAGRDAVVEGYVSVIDGMDAAAATQWAHTINDEAKRHQVVSGAFNRWIQNDPGAARDWLNNSEVQPELRAELENKLSGGKK